MDVAARRELNNGFGDTMARSFEFAVTPVIFAGIGYVIDRIVGTTLVFTIGLLVFALAGVLIRWYYDYDLKIKKVEEERVERRSATPLAAPVITRPDVEPAGLPTGITLDDSPGSTTR